VKNHGEGRKEIIQCYYNIFTINFKW